MFGPPFYYGTTRKMDVVFGTLFNNMHIHRTNANNEVEQIIRVPLTYAPKDKLLLRADKDPDATKEDAITLPRMAFYRPGPAQYDEDRRKAALHRYVIKDPDNSNKFIRTYIEVPYVLNYELYVYANHVEDGNKIIEQILPFFTPDWTVSVNILPEANVTFDVPIVLNSAQIDDKFDAQFVDRRVMVWTLPFQMKTAYFGPVKSKPIIKFAYENFLIGNTSTTNTAISTITVRPGLDANGDPTSNSSITVAANTIFVDDDYGFIEVFTDGAIGFE